MNKFYNFILFPVMDYCNLSCTYCYNKKNTSKKFLKVEDTIVFLDILKKIEKESNISITFHGGEPLLRGIDYYENIIYKIRHELSTYVNIIFQTNGLLIDDRYLELFKKYNCSVGISIDGTTFEENKNRFKTPLQFFTVVENIFKVKKYGVYFSLFFTICEFDLGRINDIHNFVECIKPKSFAINPIKGSTKTLNSEQLYKLYKLNHKFTEITGIKEFITSNLDLAKLGKIPNMCTLNGLCNNFINMDSCGNLYKTCVFKYENLKIGNIKDEDILCKIDKNTKFNLDLESSIYFKSGRNKDYRYLLGNGCKYFRKNSNLDNYTDSIIMYLNDKKEE